MAPNLRSSSANTPSGRSARTNDSAVTPTASPRKVPTCTKCKRARAGHPRSGCPYVDSPPNPNDNSPPTPAANDITNAMGSIHLTSPFGNPEEDSKAIIRERRKSARQIPPSETLLSLSESSQGIIERLLQPGLLDGDEDPPARVVQWQETLLATPLRTKRQVKMPGALFEPSIDSSLAASSSETRPRPSGPGNKRQTPEPDQSTRPALEASMSSSTSTIRAPRPLARTMSVQERDSFLASLSEAAGATAYVVPADDVHNLQASAIKIGFHARVVVNKDKSELQAILLLGADERAVQRLYEKIEMERKKDSSGRFGAVAGGAVVGAVGAFAGLAFS